MFERNQSRKALSTTSGITNELRKSAAIYVPLVEGPILNYAENKSRLTWTCRLVKMDPSSPTVRERRGARLCDLLGAMSVNYVGTRTAVRSFPLQIYRLRVNTSQATRTNINLFKSSRTSMFNLKSGKKSIYIG
jgi:hypothetical protein